MSADRISYYDIDTAMKAKTCIVCKEKMDRAYCVATLHGEPKSGARSKLHFPVCSSVCLAELYVVATLLD